MEVGLPVDALDGLGRQKLTEMLRAVPELDVSITLSAERNEHWDRPITANDERDIDALAVAIPHCAIVVTERFWCRLAERLGLAGRYGTTMLSDLTELPRMLDRPGLAPN